MDITFTIKCFMGNARAGKTLSMVATAHDYWLEIQTELERLKYKKRLSNTEKTRFNILNNFEIWTNLSLNKRIYGNYKKLNFDMLLALYESKKSINNKLIVLDDFFKGVDSRDTQKTENKVFSYFFTEIGKCHNILLYVSHFDSMVEIRLRNLTEWFILCKKGKFTKIKLDDNKILNMFIEDPEYYKLEKEKELKKMIIQQSYFRKFIDFKVDFEITRELEKQEYIKAYPFFKHYNTMEIV